MIARSTENPNWTHTLHWSDIAAPFDLVALRVRVFDSSNANKQQNHFMGFHDQDRFLGQVVVSLEDLERAMALQRARDNDPSSSKQEQEQQQQKEKTVPEAGRLGRGNSNSNLGKGISNSNSNSNSSMASYSGAKLTEKWFDISVPLDRGNGHGTVAANSKSMKSMLESFRDNMVSPIGVRRDSNANNNSSGSSSGGEGGEGEAKSGGESGESGGGGGAAAAAAMGRSRGPPQLLLRFSTTRAEITDFRVLRKKEKNNSSSAVARSASAPSILIRASSAPNMKEFQLKEFLRGGGGGGGGGGGVRSGGSVAGVGRGSSGGSGEPAAAGGGSVGGSRSASGRVSSGNGSPRNQNILGGALAATQSFSYGGRTPEGARRLTTGAVGTMGGGMQSKDVQI